MTPHHSVWRRDLHSTHREKENARYKTVYKQTLASLGHSTRVPFRVFARGKGVELGTAHRLGIDDSEGEDDVV